MQYQIREFEISDYMKIYELNREEMGYDYNPKLTQEKLRQLKESNTDQIFVAVVNGEVVGYVHANNYDLIYAPAMKNIMGIAVAKKCSHHGIGRSLLEKVEEWARQTGAKGVRLVSGSTRTDAHVFYRSCGYSGDKMQLNLKKVIEK